MNINTISRLRHPGTGDLRRLRGLGAALLMLLGLAANAHSAPVDESASQTTDATAPSQSERITRAAEDYLSSMYQDHSAGRLDIAIDSPDDRLKLATCEAPLEVSTRLGQRRFGRVTLSVSCPAGDRWSIYVAATVRAFDAVVVASTPIPRGSAISAANLSLEEKDITFLHQGYFRDIQQVVGSTANRPLSGGRVITPAQVSPPQIVNRGERVTIIASNSTLSIRAPGVALSDGALGELIQVRNASSNRIIEGRVSAPGTISVNF